MDTCVVCRRREPDSGAVCNPDRDLIASMVADLPRKLGVLPLQLMPGAGAGGERVSTSRTGSPVPGRLDALSMAGPGSPEVTAAFHPHIRRWKTQRRMTVAAVINRKLVVEERTITDWHQELTLDPNGRPVLALNDDQLGILPPAEWLASWAAVWRSRLGHHRRPAPRRPSGRYREHLDAVQRQAMATRILGLGPSRSTGPYDPLVEEWETRFGEPTRDEQPAADATYLLTYLDRICDRGDDVEIMATELRALTAELVRILGERPDQQWLGRCPATLTDTTRTRPCGAGLWQDPHASGVQCPRCHTTWPHRDILALAAEIRRVWPIDRRRRYHAGEIAALTLPRCPSCGRQVEVTWADVTATLDDRYWWRPDKTRCPAGCPEAERT